MFKLPRRRTLFVMLALAVCASFAAGSFAGHSWNNYHWARTSNPLRLKIGDNLTTSNWKGHLDASNTDWNSSKVLENTVVAGTSNKRCAAVAGTVQVCNGTYGQNGWLGLAQIWLSSGHISQGVAKMNDTYFQMSRYNIEPEKRHVMCQEVGHTFGLGHTSEDGSSQNTCMDYYSNRTQNDWTSTSPNSHDYAQLESIYGHADGTNIATRAASAVGNNEVTEDPNTWGTLMRQSKGGRSSVYERVNSDGSRTITHVYWTEEAAARGAMNDHRYDH